jgi:hypothetical protein
VRDEDGDGLVDEDPPEGWLATPGPADFAAQRIDAVPAYTRSNDASGSPGGAVQLAISPFRHPLTRPGLYPFQVLGDSLDARALAMEEFDPSGSRRLNAEDVGFIQVASFFAPEVELQPTLWTSLPGISRTFAITGTNGGNDPDSMTVSTTVVDFNQAGCNLAMMGTIPDTGSQPGCPYRAYPTVIQAAPLGAGTQDWTNVGSLATEFGPLQPLETGQDNLNILVPANWAGMEDTTYQFVITVLSAGDPAMPAASQAVVGEETVLATKESMTRYISLEMDALIASIEAGDAAGLPTGGLLPLLMRPLRMMNDGALESILSGDLETASRTMTTSVKVMEGFVRALEGLVGKLPPEVAADWRLRAMAILADLPVAIASNTVAGADSVVIASTD